MPKIVSFNEMRSDFEPGNSEKIPSGKNAVAILLDKLIMNEIVSILDHSE